MSIAVGMIHTNWAYLEAFEPASNSTKNLSADNPACLKHLAYADELFAKIKQDGQSLIKSQKSNLG